MSDEFEKIETQWGSVARGFGSYRSEELSELANQISAFCREATKATGIQIFLSYGGLLGAVRDGKLIKHDFDIDLIFLCAEDEVIETCHRLIEYLISTGAKIDVETNGQFKAQIPFGMKRVKIEFFCAWNSGDRFFQYFAIPGTVSINDVLPLGEVMLEGVAFPAPRNPVAIVEEIYGRSWKVPDPKFRYKLSQSDWEPFRFLFLSQMKTFWDNYYANPSEQKVFVSSPSGFASYVNDQLSHSARIFEIGCGNGRDSLFFAQSGHSVVAADYSSSAVDYVNQICAQGNLKLDAKVLNVQSIAEIVSFGLQHQSQFDVVYARFFTHAIDDFGLINFLRLSHRILKETGYFYAEFRSRPDEVDERSFGEELQYENGDHFRRLRSKKEMQEHLSSAGLHIVHSQFAFGLAKWKNEDPFIGRITAKKT